MTDHSTNAKQKKNLQIPDLIEVEANDEQGIESCPKRSFNFLPYGLQSLGGPALWPRVNFQGPPPLRRKKQ
jgi:hypothetical protein